MSNRQVGGLVALIIGVLLLVFSFHQRERLRQRQAAESTPSLVIGFGLVGDNSEEVRQTGREDAMVTVMLIGGLILLIGGGISLLLPRK
jgi:hypothetical protein